MDDFHIYDAPWLKVFAECIYRIWIQRNDVFFRPDSFFDVKQLAIREIVISFKANKLLF